MEFKSKNFEEVFAHPLIESFDKFEKRTRFKNYEELAEYLSIKNSLLLDEFERLLGKTPTKEEPFKVVYFYDEELYKKKYLAPGPHTGLRIRKAEYDWELMRFYVYLYTPFLKEKKETKKLACKLIDRAYAYMFSAEKRQRQNYPDRIIDIACSHLKARGFSLSQIGQIVRLNFNRSLSKDAIRVAIKRFDKKTDNTELHNSPKIHFFYLPPLKIPEEMKARGKMNKPERQIPNLSNRRPKVANKRA